MTTNKLEVVTINAVQNALKKAEQFYHQAFLLKKITFNLKGRAAGQVRFPLNKKDLPEIRFNTAILERNPDEFIKEVVPHECAHLVVYHMYLSKDRYFSYKPKPHGKEWQSVMREVYGLDPKVTHNFEVEKLTGKSFSYICACEDKTHQLSIIRHNKIMKKKTNYLCKRCGEALKALE